MVVLVVEIAAIDRFEIYFRSVLLMAWIREGGCKGT
jgi:hypothetical protein